MKTSAKETATNLLRCNTKAQALQLAEGIVKDLKELHLGDLPDLHNIASQPFVSDSMGKQLKVRASKAEKEVTNLKNHWIGVVSILKPKEK